MTAQAYPPDEPGHRFEVVAAGPTVVDDAAEALSSLALVAMILLIGLEAVVRDLFGPLRYEVVDEIGGYLLVMVTFLGMSVAESHGAFHRVELVQARMGPRARLALQIVFDACALAASVLVTWQLARLAINAWNSGDVAPTPLQTPLWLPQMFMGIGMALLCIALLRSALAKVRHFRQERRDDARRRARLRAGGLRRPAVPRHDDSVRHHRAVGALPADACRPAGPEGHRPGDLGQHEQLHADGDPAVHPDGRDPAGKPAQPARLPRPLEARLLAAGRSAADQHRRLRDLLRPSADRAWSPPRRSAASRCPSSSAAATARGCRPARWPPAARSAS